MEEKLIKFKTAKLAKNRGFDWDCVNHYSQEDCVGDEIEAMMVTWLD